MEELVIPPAVFEGENSKEFIRFWIVDGRQHISLNIGAMENEYEVNQWGMMLADLSTHIIRGLQQDGSVDNEAVLRAKIERAYLDRLEDLEVDHTGSLLGTRQ